MGEGFRSALRDLREGWQALFGDGTATPRLVDELLDARREDAKRGPAGPAPGRPRRASPRARPAPRLWRASRPLLVRIK